MKRYALAGTFALIGGLATLLLVASILHSCGQDGTPHETPYNSEASPSDEEPVRVSVAVPPAQRSGVDASTVSTARIPSGQA